MPYFKRMPSFTDVVLFALPSVIGFGGAAASPVGPTSGATVPFRPPPAVFRVVWPILFLLLGVAWATAPRRVPAMAAYASLVLLLGAWPLAYRKDRRAALYVLVASIAAALAALALHPTPLLAPLLAWLLFAQTLAAAEFR